MFAYRHGSAENAVWISVCIHTADLCVGWKDPQEVLFRDSRFIQPVARASHSKKKQILFEVEATVIYD